MAEIFCGVLSENEASQTGERSAQMSRRRRMEIKMVNQAEKKRQKMENKPSSFSGDAVVEKCFSGGDQKGKRCGPITKERIVIDVDEYPRYGAAFVCGRRRDMEDAVAIHPRLCGGVGDEKSSPGFHYFAVYDGHGCSHVAMRCRDRMHELVKEELINKGKFEEVEWRKAMDRSFNRMDKEAVSCTGISTGANCRCELRAPDSDAVGSTAVVAVVTPEKIIVANVGDSRAVLCRNGKAVPLSTDHKPDHPDELKRIHAAGGRVIYWEGARVLGVLAMSRAIGDNYLKPYVSSEPEITITDRSAGDDCLILASDGLWDVVSNETACNVARMCLKGRATESGKSRIDGNVESSDKACSDASILLTKLALARRSADNVSVVVVDLKANSSY